MENTTPYIDENFNEVPEKTAKYSDEDIQRIVEQKLMEQGEKNKGDDHTSKDTEYEQDGVAFHKEDGDYFVTDNRELHKCLNYMAEHSGALKKFTYVYDLTAERNPFVQISNYNGTDKRLSKQNFIKDFKIAYKSETGKNLTLRDKTWKVDEKTGERETEMKNGKEYAIMISEVDLLCEELQKVHDLDFNPDYPHLSTYENKENGRIVFNKFCAPRKLKEFKEKASGLPSIDKIDLDRAKEKDYLIPYAFFYNLLNPDNEDNFGDIKFGNKDDNTLTLFFNRMAYILQTLKKTNTYMLLSSDQGVGKNTYYEHFIQYIMGKEKAYLSSGDALNEQYNGYMAGKLYIAFDEAKVNAKENAEAVATRMKKFTNNEIEMREMRTDRYNAPASFNVDIFTNEDILMKVEYSDRRCICIKSGKNLADKLIAMGFETFDEFTKVFKKQVDNLIIDLLCLNYNENMAINGVIYNNYRKRIIRKTNTRISILLQLIKDRKLNELSAFFQDTPSEEKSKLDDLLLHVKYNFLTTSDTNFMLKEIYDDFSEKSNDFSKTKFWNDNIGELDPVNYTNEEGHYTSTTVRKLNGFKNKDYQTVVNLYSRATQTTQMEIEADSLDQFENEDLDLEQDDEFEPDLLEEKKVKKQSLYDMLANGEF